MFVVEDDPGTVRLFETALADADATLLGVETDGRDALETLRGRAAEGRPLPDVVFLDLHLPGADGRTVLRRLGKDSRLGRVPVIVISDSGDYDDVRAAYDLGANAYVRKPIGYGELADLIAAIDAFWFSVVEFPTREAFRQESESR